MLTCYFFLESFRNEFQDETKIQKSTIVHESEGFIAVDAPAVRSTWAQQILTDAQLMSFESIGDAAKQLQALSRGPWMDASVSHHRRAALIAEKLRVRPMKEFAFLDKELLKPRGCFVLIDQNKMLVSQKTFPFVPQGQFSFQETKEAPSRAYLKLWELFSIHGFHPSKNQTCLDMGSCPGGWTWVLSQLGGQVLSVDKAPLDPTLSKVKNIQYVKKDAFQISPKEFIDEHGPIDWFFSDIICEPARLLELVERWRSETSISNYVCTIKFKGQTDAKTLQKFLQIENSSAHHLFHNKHEVTWVLRGSAD